MKTFLDRHWKTGLRVICGTGQLGVAASMLLETVMQYRQMNTLLGIMSPDLQAAIVLQLPAPLVLAGCALGLLAGRIRNVIPVAIAIIAVYLLAITTSGTPATWGGAALLILLISAHLMLWRNMPQSSHA